MVKASEIVKETNMTKKKKLYSAYVEENMPKSNSLANTVRAFLIGGSICLVGQVITNTALYLGAGRDEAPLYSIIGLILMSVILTSSGEYSRLAKIGGAGTIVPITGFANSIASAAIEYRRENLFEGIGAQIFSIAGPVILYGILSSSVLGVIYYVMEYVL